MIPSKPPDANCTQLIASSPLEPMRVWIRIICKCNRIANEKFPGICDLTCPNWPKDDDGCTCTNPYMAGLVCDMPMCKYGEKDEIYCMRRGNTESCDANIDRSRLHNLPTCANRPTNMSMIIGICGLFVIVFIILPLVCRLRRIYVERRLQGRSRAATAVPGPTIPGSTVAPAGYPHQISGPLAQNQHLDTGAIPGSVDLPSTGKPSASALSQDPAPPVAITMTYTFQPVDNGKDSSHNKK